MDVCVFETMANEFYLKSELAFIFFFMCSALATGSDIQSGKARRFAATADAALLLEAAVTVEVALLFAAAVTEEAVVLTTVLDRSLRAVGKGFLAPSPPKPMNKC